MTKEEIENCSECDGKMVKYILQPKTHGTEMEGKYYAPRLMAKCEECGMSRFLQKLPMVDEEIKGALHSFPKPLT